MEHSGNVRVEPDFRALLEELRARINRVDMELARGTGELPGANQRIEAGKAEHSALNETMNRLAGCIAHDLNNVFGAILGWVELAEVDVQPESKVRQQLERIREQAERGVSIAAEFQAFARSDSDIPPRERDAKVRSR